MNKKLLSAILFGALAASTSTFVSCKDYDDDIDRLQMQIDQNATTAANDLASKIAALESQLSTLNAAKETLADQLAAAKAEAATAAANALAAAQTAQAAADAAKAGGDAAAAAAAKANELAQKGVDGAAAAQNTANAAANAAANAQTTADKANAAAAAAQKVADQAVAEITTAVARVATLETKVTNLEGIANDLKVANVELNSKVSDLQTQVAAVKADTKANTDAIAAANAQILAKATELSTQINKLSADLGARIDVIDNTLNTIKSTYATKDELNTKAQELAAMDAQLSSQIAANLKFIETLQATVKELASKDAELAAKIESNYATLLDKINAITVEQANMLKSIEALQAASTELKTQYSSLASTKADLTYVDNINNQLTTLINSLQKTLNDLTASDASQAATINVLLQDVSKLKEDMLNLQNKVDANAAAADANLKAAVAELQAEIKAVAEAADKALQEEVAALEAQIAENAAAIADIKEELATKASQDEVDALTESLIMTQLDVTNLIDGLRELKGQIAAQDAELKSLIADAEKAAKDYAYNLVLELTNTVSNNIIGIENNAAAIEGNADAIAANAKTIEAILAAIEELKDLSNGPLAAFVTGDELNDELNALYEGISNELDNYVAIVDLKRLYADRAEMNDSLNVLKEAIAAHEEAYEAKMAEVDAEFATIKAELERLGLDYAQMNVINNKVNALIENIQSIVFVPQYNGVDVPVYGYVHNDGSLNAEITDIKFRLEPATAAAEVAALWGAEGSKLTLALESSDALKEATRAAYKHFEITGVEADGAFLVVSAKNNLTYANNDNEEAPIYPTTLVVGNEWAVDTVNDETVALSKTSDYFNVELITLNEVLENNPAAITKLLNDTTSTYKHIEFTPAKEYSNLEEVGTASVEIHYNYVGQEHALANMFSTFKNGEFVLPEVSKDLVIVASEGDADYFTVSETGVAVKGLADGNPDTLAIGKSLVVTIADKLYGKTGDNWNVTYEVTYKITENVYKYDFDLGTLEIEWPDENDTVAFTAADITDVEGMAEYGLTAETLFGHIYNELVVRTKLGNLWTERSENVTRIELVPGEDGKTIYMVGLSNKVESNYDDGDVTYAGELGLTINHIATVNFKGAVSLTIPDPDKYLEKHTIWWTNEAGEEADIELNVNYAYSDLAENYYYRIEMPTVYKNYDLYNGVDGIDYVWTLNNAENIEGIEFDGDTLKITGPITVNGEAADINDGSITFNLNVVTGETVLATAKNQQFRVTYPVDEFEGLEPMSLTADKLKDASEEAMKVIGKVTLTDNDGAVWVKDGQINPNVDPELGYVATKAWGVENLKYEVVKVEIDATGEDLTEFNLFSVDEVNGALIVNAPENITKTVNVTIKVSVDYTFEKNVGAEYVVTVLPMEK